LHRGYLSLLPRDDFLGKLSDEWVPPVDQYQASHFDGSRVVRYHDRKKIPVRITCLPRRHHFVMHPVHSGGHHSAKLRSGLGSIHLMNTVLAHGWRDQ
jgi:hypothetical protein